jgi:hypothetical protein
MNLLDVAIPIATPRGKGSPTPAGLAIDRSAPPRRARTPALVLKSSSRSRACYTRVVPTRGPDAPFDFRSGGAADEFVRSGRGPDRMEG